ncbi:MAG: 23S rRNA (pseudouridine(1915)-N(3))-methyltransferase RlmH [Candidatus Cloacimonetes bacterium]|nr:23S rRNA (pseudouridine(1915)-N(3))-methyltransferase RlmH [Candidatus Cloacimonadota bacterium]HNZ06288.1 23S rRNA (pseudouridine(1915)-N(3))-methyltransferase RlmH [Candidatus Cloacimonadota bacterium]HOH78306.1 23S rRNA (pseudouridine(1915)-N(3))-methyltransferase RlmH [Candidatus Cloacimonadota bacterium]
MNLALVQIGKTKDRWLQEGIDEYLKRLGPYHNLNIIELPDHSRLNSQNSELVQSREADAALKQIGEDDYLVLLDEAGQLKSSLEFSRFLTSLSDKRRVVFLIGGAFGTHKRLKDRANQILSLSPLTFTHRMARLILIEQIYRATMIAQGRSYHI